jgi:hypothetical protein
MYIENNTPVIYHLMRHRNICKKNEISKAFFGSKWAGCVKVNLPNS